MVDFYDDTPDSDGKTGVNRSNTSKIPGRKTAVALDKSAQRGELPRITAAGRGKIAEKILQLAYEHDIKVREDKVLTEMLAKLELDSPIPSEAFMAVAEILSYVYRASGQPNPFDTVMAEES